ncbi:MAG: NAD(P)H-hydrate dehydratase [Myxococcota bacterium]
MADIAIPTSLLKELSPRARVFDARDSLSLAPERAADAHKGDCGHVVVWAGSSQTPGAAVLALGGALRGGAGRVSWMTDRATLAMSSPRPPEVMLRLLDDITPDSWLEGADAVVLGPGLSQGASTQQILRQLFESICVPVCLDADALNMIASDPELWSSLPASAVLTPHPKEMARLVGCTVHDVKGDPIGVAVDLAEKRQCSVVLKGAVTVVATPGEATTVFDNLCPALATGGTGDVLAGLIGALLGQGLASPRAAQLGVWVHNQAGQIAAQRHGVLGVIASDVVTCIGAVWRDLDGARANDDEK